MKKLLVFIVLICTLSLSGCSILKDLKAGMNDATLLVEEFCANLSEDNLNACKELLHPKGSLSLNFEEYISRLEQAHHINFSNGIFLKRRLSFSSTYYDSEYDGTVHEMEYLVTVGGASVEMSFTVVKNDSGYGVYDFNVNSF